MQKLKKERVLVVVAHPDDEVLGCAGAIASHRKMGNEVKILFVADGMTSRRYDPDRQVSRKEELARDAKAIARRQKEAVNAGSILGVSQKNIVFLNLPDQRLDSCPLLDIVKRIEKVKASFQPSIVYTHFWNDLNKDHQVVCRAVLTAFRPGFDKNHTDVFHMEIPETTRLSIPHKGKDFKPNHYVDISKVLESKIKALEAYESEKRIFPHPRSTRFIRQLALKRGRESAKKAAEAFMPVPF